jgi:hypothetical protein
MQLVGLPPPDEEDDVLDEDDVLVDVEEVLDVELEDVLPLQLSPQIDATSPTHCASQRKSQQNASVPQICVTHGSQPEVSELPVVQSECVQLPPLDEVEVEEELLVLEEELLLIPR